MLQLATKAFGTIEVNDANIFQFADGLFGFHDSHSFALLDEKNESPFKWLQSTDDSTLAFILIQPEIFLKDKYRPDVSMADLEALEVNSVDECFIYLIVTIPENKPELMTANLQGPILLNRNSQIGRQAISTNNQHGVRVSILEQMGG